VGGKRGACYVGRGEISGIVKTNLFRERITVVGFGKGITRRSEEGGDCGS